MMRALDRDGAGLGPARSAAGRMVKSDRVKAKLDFALQFAPLALVIACWLLATAGSVLLTPPRYLVGGIFAVATLLAAHRYEPRAVAAIGAGSVILDFLNGWIDPPPVSAWAFNVAAQVAVVYLGVQLAAQRQRSLLRARDAEEAREQLREFMGMVSHDMRGPLFTVLARTQLLEEDAREDERESLHAIEVAARQLRRFADDLIDAARIGAGHFTMDAAPCDLVPVLRQVIGQFQSSARDHHFVLAVPDKLPGRWDRGRIEQLFNNLLSNAIKYSPPGSEVRLTATDAADRVEVGVKDQGVGLTADELRQLFKPFSRPARPSGRAEKGTGLGLYIAKAIVDAQGGRIWAESVPGSGSTFHVVLPLTEARATRPGGGANVSAPSLPGGSAAWASPSSRERDQRAGSLDVLPEGEGQA